MARDYQTRGYVGGAPTTSTLAGSMGTGDTTFSFNTGGGTGFPTTNFWVVFDPLNGSAEKMLVGSRSGDACTGVVRAVDNTTAKSHSAGASILHTGAAQDFTEANAVAAALTTKGDSLWKGGTLSVAPARLAAGSDQQHIRYLAANALGVETTWLGSIPVYASTAARDAALASASSGQACYIDSGDTVEGLWFYNGTNWRRSWNEPWGRLASAAATTNQGSITSVVDLTSMSVTFTAVTRRVYKVSFQGVLSSTVGTDPMAILLTNGSGVQYAMARTQGPGSNLATASGVVEFSSVVGNALTAGSNTMKLRAQRTLGTGTVTNSASATEPTVLIVEDIGPDTGAPA